MSDPVDPYDVTVPAKEECRDLTDRVGLGLGGAEFAGHFDKKRDYGSQYVYGWKINGTGPFWWMRKLLIQVEKDIDDGPELVRQILNFLCKPFGLQVTEIKKNK